MSVHISLQLPRVAIERWVPGTVAVPTFHCRRCLNHWKAYGELPWKCNEPKETVEGPPMYLTSKANFGRRMPIRNAYNARGKQLQICVDVTAGRQSRVSETDLQPGATEVDADALWDLTSNELDHSGSDNSAIDDVQFLSHSCMSTSGHGSVASGTAITQLPPITVSSNGSGTVQVLCATSETGTRVQSVLADSLGMQKGSNYPPFMHGQLGNTKSTLGNTHHRHMHSANKVGHSGQDNASNGDHVSSADGTSHHSISAVAQDGMVDQHGGRMGNNGQGRMMGSSKGSSYGDGEVSHSTRGHDGATYSRECTDGSDLTHYSTAQKQGTSSPHSLLESGHRAKRANSRNAGGGGISGNSPSPGSNTTSLQTTGRTRSSALAGEGPMGSIMASNTCSRTESQQLLHTSSSVLRQQSFHDGRPPFTGKHEVSIDGNEQSGRQEHQNSQSPASSRSVVSAAEPKQTSVADPGCGTVSGQGKPRTQENKVLRRATIKENVEFVPDKVRVGKKKKAQLRKGIHPTGNSQATSSQGAAVNRRGSYVLAQAGSRNGMHQIDTSKLEEQRQAGAAAAHAITAIPPQTLHNTTKSRDVSFPTRHNSKNLDEVVHQSPDLYHNKGKPPLQHTEINPSSQTESESASHSQRVPSGWRQRGDLKMDQTSGRLLTEDQDVSGTGIANDTDGGEFIAPKGQDRKLLFSHGAGSDPSAVHTFLQQQSQALDDTARRSSSTKQPSALQDQYLPKGKATVDIQQTTTASTVATGTASLHSSVGTTSVQVESKLSNPISCEQSLRTISEVGEGDEALAELEYYNSVRPTGFDIMSVINFTRSFTYSMFPMSKQHKESCNAIHSSANTTGRRQIKRTAVKS